MILGCLCVGSVVSLLVPMDMCRGVVRLPTNRASGLVCVYNECAHRAMTIVKCCFITDHPEMMTMMIRV